eukprot:4796360-Heterocapsa_arctica.AAC.1
MPRDSFGLAICRVQLPWAGQMCVIRPGESAPRSTLTCNSRCLGWLGGGNICGTVRVGSPKVKGRLRANIESPG